MAIMYPDKPKQFAPNSREDLMFEALSKLPNTYYVFHSFAIVTVRDGMIWESETDFVIYNEEKGILCLEAKNGQVSCSDGYWQYGNGERMPHDGPYRQAANNKWKLAQYIRDTVGLKDIFERCKMVHAVWFPAVSKDKFIGISLPAESDLKLTLTKEAEDDIENAISDIFSYEISNKKETKLTSRDTDILLKKVFAPQFNLVSIAVMKHTHNEYVFKTLLKEQIALLNYLDEQNTAVINGMAGTGKTIMAVTKATRHADKGESVLFLCYNKKLKEHLQEAYPHENIAYYTIDGLACKMCDTNIPDYILFKRVLSDLYGSSLFPYQHVIIDEGQDFEEADEQDIISLLKNNALDDEEREGSFYLFYDKNQMIQSVKAPEYIDTADCRLKLYKNCRNSVNIATTALRLLGSEDKPKLIEGALEGDSPEFYFANSVETTVKILNMIVDEFWKNDYTNIQILTCLTEKSSIIAAECSTGIYTYKRKQIPFTTCKKFKGLEADAVIVIDIDKDKLKSEGDMNLYVGASRARFKLALIGNLNKDDCEKILDERKVKKTKKPEKAVSALYNAKYKAFEQ